MRISIVRRYRFEAAHTLPWHPGKCSRTHGHSYVLEVQVAGELDNRGVVMDFAEVCQGPLSSAQRRSWNLPGDGHETCPVVAMGSAQRWPPPA